MPSTLRHYRRRETGLSTNVFPLGETGFTVTSGQGVGLQETMGSQLLPISRDPESLAAITALISQVNGFRELLTQELAALRVEQHARPTLHMLLSLDNSRLVLTQPIPVLVEATADGAVASIADWEAYGDGADETEAVDVLRRRVADDFEELSAQEHELGPHLQKVLNRLRGYIRATDK